MTDEPIREPPPGIKRHYWRVDPDTSDEELLAWAERVVEELLAGKPEK